MSATKEGLVLAVGRTYEAKKPRSVGVFDPLIDDRMIVWLGIDQVQYDSPTVRVGYRRPVVKREAFERWAGRDVTELMPKGEWRPGK